MAKLEHNLLAASSVLLVLYEAQKNMNQDSKNQNPKAQQFEQRKRDHIRLSLDDMSQTKGRSGFEKVQLNHEAFPELDFSDVELKTEVFNTSLATPFVIGSMTGGHQAAENLNLLLAKCAAQRGWLMGVGSQRRELFDSSAALEWQEIRKKVPDVRLVGNLGITQVIHTPIDDIKKMMNLMGAFALYVHTNPLQECIQPEGTPQFKGGLQAVNHLCRSLEIPVIVKETGCGFSQLTFNKLKECGVAAVEVSGLGGTHWGRIEGARSDKYSLGEHVSRTFANWGVSTVESVLNAQAVDAKYGIWGSGGVRSGLDAAKLLALGCDMVSIAQPLLKSAMDGEKELDLEMQRFELELKTALFCTGSANIQQFRRETVWQIQK